MRSSMRILFLISHHNVIFCIVEKFPNLFPQPSPGDDHHPRSMSHIDLPPFCLLLIYLILISTNIKTCSLTTIICYANYKKQKLKTSSCRTRRISLSWENNRVRREEQFNLDFLNTGLLEFPNYSNYFLGPLDFLYKTIFQQLFFSSVSCPWLTDGHIIGLLLS